jgi:hypothetical protein
MLRQCAADRVVMQMRVNEMFQWMNDTKITQPVNKSSSNEMRAFPSLFCVSCQACALLEPGPERSGLCAPPTPPPPPRDLHTQKIRKQITCEFNITDAQLHIY